MNKAKAERLKDLHYECRRLMDVAIEAAINKHAHEIYISKQVDKDNLPLIRHYQKCINVQQANIDAAVSQHSRVFREIALMIMPDFEDAHMELCLEPSTPVIPIAELVMG